MALTATGDLRDLVTFQRRSMVDDGYGNPITGPWEDEFTAPARIQFLRGSETVIASRLQGTKVCAITIRCHPQAAEVTPAWRAYDTRAGMLDATNPKRGFNIRAVEVDERKLWINLLCEEGVAS